MSDENLIQGNVSIKSYKDLLVWQKAHQLALDIYQITKDFPAEEKFGLVSQMRRAAVSVASNIVEGFRKRGAKDKVNFYNRAQGSLDELEYQLLLSSDLNYLKVHEIINGRVDETAKMLNGLIRSVLRNE